MVGQTKNIAETAWIQCFWTNVLSESGRNQAHIVIPVTFIDVEVVNRTENLEEKSFSSKISDRLFVFWDVNLLISSLVRNVIDKQRDI